MAFLLFLLRSLVVSTVELYSRSFDKEMDNAESSYDLSSGSTSESDIGDPGVLVPYSKEPEWSDGERGEAEGSEEDEGSEDADVGFDLWPPASRVGNTAWCLCGQCEAMPTWQECVCCGELPETERKIADREETCVTYLPNFVKVCLDKEVLETALNGIFDLTKRPLNTPPDNK